MILTATPSGFLRSGHDITVDGDSTATLTPRGWSKRAGFTLDGARYEIGQNFWGTRYTLTDPQGSARAHAEGIGRRRWTVSAGGITQVFQRPSPWSRESLLVDAAGVEIGHVRRTGTLRMQFEADLPDTDPAVAVFTLGVVVLVAVRNATAAASG